MNTDPVVVSDITIELADGFALAAPVPEASTWAMMLIGFAGIGMVARKRALSRKIETA
jgi:hypothetical protein